MPRCFSISIQSLVAWRVALRAFTLPAIWIAPENSSSFSVSVVLPASGWEMMAKVRRRRTWGVSSDMVARRRGAGRFVETAIIGPPCARHGLAEAAVCSPRPVRRGSGTGAACGSTPPATTSASTQSARAPSVAASAGRRWVRRWPCRRAGRCRAAVRATASWPSIRMRTISRAFGGVAGASFSELSGPNCRSSPARVAQRTDALGNRVDRVPQLVYCAMNIWCSVLNIGPVTFQ